MPYTQLVTQEEQHKGSKQCVGPELSGVLKGHKQKEKFMEEKRDKTK